MYEITNGILSASVDGKGAQLRSIRSLKTGREYIWSADPEIWGRSAPILFPAVGRMYKDGYIYDGKRYSMSKHGFMRDEQLFLKEKTDANMTFSYSPTDKIKRIYPFDFVFDVSFVLFENTFTMIYNVENTGNKEMYFSLGAHPGFSCKMGDTVILGEQEGDTVPYFDADDRPNGKSFACLSEGRSFSVTDDLFLEGTLVFSLPSSKSVSLRDNSGEYLRVEFGRVPHLWIWAKQRAEFICIEPWHGADECVSEEELAKKSGIIALPAGKTFSFPVKLIFPRETL